MNYRKVIEEQIEKLTRFQEQRINQLEERIDLICLIAETIAKLTKTASELPQQSNEPGQ